MPSTKSFKVTGLWPKALKNTKLLQATIAIDDIKNVIKQLEAMGLDRVTLEVWETLPDMLKQGGPTHQLKMAEPFVPRQEYNNQSNRLAGERRYSKFD